MKWFWRHPTSGTEGVVSQGWGSPYPDHSPLLLDPPWRSGIDMSMDAREDRKTLNANLQYLLQPVKKIPKRAPEGAAPCHKASPTGAVHLLPSILTGVTVCSL